LGLAARFEVFNLLFLVDFLSVIILILRKGKN